MKLPIIVGFGGISAAGRSSNGMALLRCLMDGGVLSSQQQREVVRSLSALTSESEDHVLNNSLIRCLTESYGINMRPHNLSSNIRSDTDIIFDLAIKDLPNPLPLGWQVENLSVTRARVKVLPHSELSVLIKSQKSSRVNVAGALPEGFSPDKWYTSKNHPRGLQIAVFAINDALESSGLNWDELSAKINPDMIGVYASSTLGQLDENGLGGLLTSGIEGKYVSARQLPLGYPQMSADFISGYVLGNIGMNQGMVGACASFLYNLNAAVNDIAHGYKKLAIVGASDALILGSIIDGFDSMKALAQDRDIRSMLNIANDVSLISEIEKVRLSAAAFSDNVGFIMGESAQYFILMSDDLVLETGAQILGSVPNVFINADGYKKSITSPGIGNHISIAQAASATQQLIGKKNMSERSYVHAHGTSTPQNRRTESTLMNETAKYFGIESWAVTAVKSYIGHSQASAAGDQLAFACSSWQKKWVPAVIAHGKNSDDVQASNLDLLRVPLSLEDRPMEACLINSKGFGGNNATAVLLCPDKVEEMLEKRHGKSIKVKHSKLSEKVIQRSESYHHLAQKGEFNLRYKYNNNVLDDTNVKLSKDEICVDGYPPIPFRKIEGFDDMI